MNDPEFIEESEKIQNNDRIYLNDQDSDTVNSNKLRSFIWSSSSKEKYHQGKLIVRFSNGYVYTYNVPRDSYIKLCEAAYNGVDPFKTYDENMIDWVTSEKKEEDSVLYIERFKI